MTKRQVLLAVKKWLKQPGNTKAELARSLGYRSHSTITNWIKRKSVPSFRIDDIMEEITKCPCSHK